MKIYAWAGVKIKTKNKDVLVIAYPETAENLSAPIGSWVSRDIDSGKQDIVYSIKKTVGDQPFDLEWIDDITTHPWTRKFIDKQEQSPTNDLLTF